MNVKYIPILQVIIHMNVTSFVLITEKFQQYQQRYYTISAHICIETTYSNIVTFNYIYSYIVNIQFVLYYHYCYSLKNKHVPFNIIHTHK